MSGVGFWELIILLLIGLIVLGPERLPRVANQLGTWLGQARRMTRMMKRQLEEELNLEREPGIRPARLSAPPPTSPRRQYESHSPTQAGASTDVAVGTDGKGDTDRPGSPQPHKDEAPAPSIGDTGGTGDTEDDAAGTNKAQ